ncbi:MAG: hypothetical protein PHO26_02995 [Dehalococcoidia bacterium]|nr:hypothetical protein [Dehalococcoidia bacterium]MDD5493475.1 hypothetical protein [Dehalococcoidia bacterium]
MKDELKKFIDAKFNIPPIEGEDKVCSLEEAVSKNLRRGMSFHFAGKGGALFYQLVREFWGKNANFTLISPSLASLVLVLLCGNLLKKAVISFAGNSYPTPGPNPLVQKAYITRAVEFENWSMLTITQRLMAGAMGWDFIPTNSLIGSSIAKDNKNSFKVIESPFNSGNKIGLVKALRPDITMVHGIAADRSGNTILSYPLNVDAFGAWAAKEGVIVSVENIVSTEYIRSHAHMVRIPSYMVKAVCEVPFGAHPSGMSSFGVSQFEGYFEDYEFATLIRNASMDENKFLNFIQEWILDCPDPKQYFEKIGGDRLRYLKDKAKPYSWVAETLAAVPVVEFDKEANRLETMVIAGSRFIMERCKSKGYKNILAGIGLSNLAAWMATYKLKETGYDVDLVAEIGMYGYLPRPSDPTVFSMHNFWSCKMLSNIETALGVMVGGPTNSCMGVLAGGQIDVYGNANSTEIPGVFYMVGSGGANDIVTTCRETIAFCSSGKERLVEKVPYITYPGNRVKTLITDVGIFEKLDGEEKFTLTAYSPYATALEEEEAIKSIKKVVSWEVEVAPKLKRIDLPSQEEIMMVRLFDPRGYYTKS